MNRTIKNEKLTLTVSESGAEIQSLCDAGGFEYIYDGSGVWNKRAPILFPIVGRLKNETYTYRGKEYTLPGHGFASRMDFETVKDDGSELLFRLADSEQTRRNYPFSFELLAGFRLDGGTVSVTYTVNNTGDGEMYFSVGAHEGYRCPMAPGEQFTDYRLIFEKRETQQAAATVGPLLGLSRYPFLEDTDTVRLRYSYFVPDAVVLLGQQSHKLTLKSDISGRGVEVCFPDFPMLGIWTKPGAPFLCIEPWCGVCDPVDSDGDITKKFGINRLEPGGSFVRTHTIRPF